VPEWATAQKATDGWQVDAYSREAWDQALGDFNAEATPMPFFGERQEPNPLQWLRLEQFGKGMSSRLFYNEVPNTTWMRHQGHMDNIDETLYSFTNADQGRQMLFGMDTTTEEGRELYRQEYEALSAIAPEILKKEDMIYPHELPKPINTEAHF